jgi:hypothetical protein
MKQSKYYIRVMRRCRVDSDATLESSQARSGSYDQCASPPRWPRRAIPSRVRMPRLTPHPSRTSAHIPPTRTKRLPDRCRLDLRPPQTVAAGSAPPPPSVLERLDAVALRCGSGAADRALSPPPPTPDKQARLSEGSPTAPVFEGARYSFPRSEPVPGNPGLRARVSQPPASLAAGCGTCGRYVLAPPCRRMLRSVGCTRTECRTDPQSFLAQKSAAALTSLPRNVEALPGHTRQCAPPLDLRILPDFERRQAALGGSEANGSPQQPTLIYMFGIDVANTMVIRTRSHV